MDTMQAFARGEAARAGGARMRVFDWNQAARMIREKGITEAEAGLSGDLDWTGGLILADGKPVSKEDTYTYLASVWAVPVLVVGEYDPVETECWAYQEDTPGWDAHTYWPDSALAILNEERRESDA